MHAHFSITLALAALLCAQPLAALAQAAAGPAPVAAAHQVFEGRLTYYGKELAGRKTASGEPFDPDGLTMAHRTLPLGTLVRVTNPKSRRSVVVRVNDRGPSSRDRAGDVSLAAARVLKMLQAGVLHAQMQVVATADAAQDTGAQPE